MKNLLSKKLIAVVIAMVCVAIISMYGFEAGMDTESIIAITAIFLQFVREYSRDQTSLDKHN